MINYLLVATAKNLQNKNKNIIKKEKRSDDPGYAAAFSASIMSRLWSSALLSTTSQTILKVL